MRKVISAVGVLLLATPVAAEEWHFEDASIPIAYFDNGNAQLQFACRGGDLTVGFWVRTPHHVVAKASSMSLAITPDPATGTEAATTGGTSFAQEIPLIHSNGTSAVIRGPVAQRWARIAQQAATTIRIAYVRKQSTPEVFDSNNFGAKGSSAAIRKVLDHCG